MIIHGNTRSIPDGFAAVASTMSLKDLARKFNAGQVIIIRWRKQLGWVNPFAAFIDPPADFAERARTTTTAVLRQHYGVGERRIKSWSRITGVQPAGRSALRRAIPDDFAEVAPTMVKTSLTKHYNADIKTVTRWLEASGVRAAVPVAAYHPRKGYIAFRGHAAVPVHRSHRPSSIHDDAADILRKWFVCFRCDARGRADQKAAFWRVGNVICTPDELLQRAAKKARAA